MGRIVKVPRRDAPQPNSLSNGHDGRRTLGVPGSPDLSDMFLQLLLLILVCAYLSLTNRLLPTPMKGYLFSADAPDTVLHNQWEELTITR